MKILIQMGDSYPDESPCAKRMRTFYEAFCKEGDQVIVLAPKTAGGNQSYPDTIYCRTVPLKKKTVVYRLLNSIVFGMTSYLKAIPIKDVDVVLTTSPPPLINWFGYKIAKSKHAFLVYDVRDIWPDIAWEMGSFSEKSAYSKVFSYLRDMMLRKADLTIAVSPGKVRKLKQYNKNARVEEVANGIDEAFLANGIDESVVSKYDLKRGRICSYIGNLGLAQGLQQLLSIAERALTEMPDMRFVLFGSGAEEDVLKGYVKTHNLSNVEFPGRIPNKQMYTVLKCSTVSFVSLVNGNLKDSVPTKMFEALGVGCPVLLAAEGDAVDILNNSRLGKAVSPNQTEDLWNAFCEICQNTENYLKIRKEGIEYIVSNYSRQKIASRFEILLKELLKEKENG